MQNTIRALVLVGIVLLIFPGGQAVADGVRSRWWHKPDYVQQLTLSDDEVQRMDEAYETARIKMIEIKSKIEIERIKLRALMEQKKYSETAVLEQHRKQEAARSKLSEERFRFLLDVRSIVGHDRFIKLLEIQDERRQRRHSKRQTDLKEKE